MSLKKNAVKKNMLFLNGKQPKSTTLTCNFVLSRVFMLHKNNTYVDLPIKTILCLIFYKNIVHLFNKVRDVRQKELRVVSLDKPPFVSEMMNVCDHEARSYN